MGNIITNYLLKNGIIDESDIAIYQYGEFVFLFNLLLIIFAVLFAYFIGEAKFIISFFVFCIPLRIFLGGFHCTTPFRCFVFSELLYVSIILLYKFNIFCNYNNLIIFFTLIACTTNFIFNNKESKIVRLIVFLVFILELFVYFLLPGYGVHIIYGFFCCSFLYYYQFIVMGRKYLINLIIV